MKFTLKLLEVLFAMLSMISVIGIIWECDGPNEGIKPVLLWVAVFVTSIFLLIYLSQINKSSKLEVPNARTVITMMTDSVKAILGAISLVAAVFSAAGLAFSTFQSRVFFVCLAVFLSTPLLLLFAVGRRRVLYLIIIPSMAVPIFVDKFVYKVHDNGDALIFLVFAGAIIPYLIIKRYYAKKHIEKG